jgi:hypothetical protein
MPFIPLEEGRKVVMRFTGAGQQECNVYYVTDPSPADVSSLNAIADVFLTWWDTNLRAAVSNNTTLDAIEVTDISTEGGFGIEFTSGLPLAGGAGGGLLPNNVTVATKLTTGRTGRSYRGRKYFVGLGNDQLAVDKQHITAGFQAALQGAYELLISELITAGVQLVIASFVSGGVPRTTGVATPVIGASVNPTLDSQRRRLPERGS